MTFILANWRYILLAILIASNGLLWTLWRNEVADFSEYKQKVEVERRLANELAEAERVRIDAQYRKTLEEVSNAWNEQLPAIRKEAIARYKAKYGSNPFSRCLQQSTNNDPLQLPEGESPESPHGTAEELLSCSSQFIADAAEDAAKVMAWQELAEKNDFEVE